MKKFSYYFMLLITMLSCGFFLTACDDDDDASLTQLSVSFVNASATSAQFYVDTKNISECAYMVQEASETKAPTNEVIFAKGTHFKAVSDTITIDNLKPNAKQVLYLAGKLSNDNLYPEVASVSFTTTDFTEPITVVEKRHEGFSVHVKVPESVKANNNAVRFTRGVLPFYNMLKMQGVTDADMLLSNGGDERSTTDAVTYTFDEKHSIIVDEATGEEYEIDSPIVPGEPSVFMAGEFTYGESPYGWGEGYYTPLFDTDKWFEDQMGGGGMLMSFDNDPNYEKEMTYWSGYHHREIIVSKEPALLNGGVKVDTVKLTANNASLLFTPDENVFSYCVMVIDDAMYRDMILPMFDNDEKYLQWFTTSFMAFSQLGAQSFTEKTEFNLDEFYDSDFIEPDLKFHILITALGDENGSSQSFQHLEIVTPQRTMAAPVVAVTSIDNPDGEVNPYEVWFNIKTTSDVKLAKGKYVANYERETLAMLNNGYDEATLVEESGVEFTPEEVEYINSAAGLNVRFDSRANATTCLIAVGYNEEGLNSEATLGKNKSADLPKAEAINSPYTEGLNGEWTASVKLSRMNYELNEWVEDSLPTQFKVNIGNELAHPATLPSEVYELYEGKSKEEVDQLYNEFKTLSNDYVNRLNEQNCLLCTGFNIEGVEDGDLESKTPYELFTDLNYNGVNNEALFFDFGPKWFLHISADNTIGLPINTDYMAPMSCWKTDGPYRQNFYLVGLGNNAYVGTPTSSAEAWTEFPVEVSEDMNQITIHPLEITDAEGTTDFYYPSPVTLSWGQARPAAGCKTISAITLTRGWDEAAAATAKVSRSSNNGVCAPMVSFNGKSITPKVRPMGRTSFVNTQKINRVKMAHRVTPEEFKAGMTKLAMQWLKGQQIKK